MNCPDCGGDTYVINSRISPEGNVVNRSRQCKRCDKRTYTVEFSRAELAIYQTKARNGDKVITALRDSLGAVLLSAPEFDLALGKAKQ